MKRLVLVSMLALAAGCASTTSYVKTDTQLGRVVVYRNGIAYFERYATVSDGELELDVPADKVDDFLKSLTVVDAKTGEPAPIAYPTRDGEETTGDGLVSMKIKLKKGAHPQKLKLTYVTEAPAWKPSYRVVVDDEGKVHVQAWAIVDNTSGEDWNDVRLGVGASSALSFRYDLRSIRLVERETLGDQELFAQAPPIGGATYGGEGNAQGAGALAVYGELSDDALARNIEAGRDESKDVGSLATSGAAGGGSGRGGVAGVPGGGAYGQGKSTTHHRAPAADPSPAATRSGDTEIATLAQRLRSSNERVVIEGYADPSEKDQKIASLDRANRVRETLIQNGVAPEQVVAVGNGARDGRAGGVRIVADKRQAAQPGTEHGGADGQSKEGAGPVDALEPIGTSHFESKSAMTVPRGTSAMVSIINTKTEGRVVYFYDAESERGNASFPFKAVRIVNPTDSALEGGPVTVFGEGRFIGEGLADDIPARSASFVPFALDRQIIVERNTGEEDRIAKIISVQRGVFSTEVQHVRAHELKLTSRLTEPATVYLRHTVAHGFELTDGPSKRERLGSAHLFQVVVPPGESTTVTIEESTPVFKTTDIRSPEGMKQISLFLSSGAYRGSIKERVQTLIDTHKDMADVSHRIDTLREQMNEYRARMDELHAQLVTLKAVRTAGPLMKSLEDKLADVSDRVSESTLELVGLQEKLMVARIRFQDGVAELSLEAPSDSNGERDGAPANATASSQGG